jgi:hydrolase, TatD family
MFKRGDKMYFDTHTHLNSDELYINLQQHIDKALKENIDYMLVVGYDIASSKKALEIASLYSFIHAVVGIGPNDGKDVTIDDLKEIEAMLSNPKVVAIGEIGLDYYWDTVGKEKQVELFLKQIDLAKKYGKPIVIHCRDAMEDTYQILKKTKHYGVMHCYSGSYEMAKRFVDINYMISLAGPITFKNAKEPKVVAEKIDLEHLVIETDCPYLTPHPYRGKLNEPANVKYIAKEIAIIKNKAVEEIAKITTFNAKRIFGIK